MTPQNNKTLLHHLQLKIKNWPRQQYFYQWFFAQKALKDKKKNINRFIDDKDFLINISGMGNENYIKYTQKLKQDERKKKIIN